MDKVERARDILSFTMASRGAKRQNYEAVKSPAASHLVKISADCAIAAIEAALEPLAERVTEALAEIDREANDIRWSGHWRSGLAQAHGILSAALREPSNV